MSKITASAPATYRTATPQPAASGHHISHPLLARGLAGVGLAGTALVHLVQLPDTWQQSPILGAMFATIVAGTTVAAIAMVAAEGRLLWQATLILGIAPIFGYILTRFISVPFDNTDVGNWFEPLGLASLFIEAALVGVCVDVLLAWPRRHHDLKGSCTAITGATERA